MKARKLRQLLGDCVGTVENGYIISHNEKSIIIGSGYVSDLIAVDKETKKITYAMDTFREGEKCLTNKLIEINQKLKELIASGTFNDVIDGQDYIENPLPVFTYDNYKKYEVIKTFTDAYDYPNITITGEVMYQNTFFKTQEDCIKKAIENTDYSIEALDERYSELQKDLEKNRERRNKLQAFKHKIYDNL